MNILLFKVAQVIIRFSPAIASSMVGLITTNNVVSAADAFMAGTQTTTRANAIISLITCIPRLPLRYGWRMIRSGFGIIPQNSNDLPGNAVLLVKNINGTFEYQFGSGFEGLMNNILFKIALAVLTFYIANKIARYVIEVVKYSFIGYSQTEIKDPNPSRKNLRGGRFYDV